MEPPAYLFVLSMGPAMLALVTSAWWMFAVSAVLLLIAWKTHQGYAAARARSSEVGARPVWIEEDGIFMEGILGPARWGWSAVDHVRIAGAHVVVQLASREMLAFPVTGAEAERMVAFISERSQMRLVDSPGRLLFLLAVLYGTSIVAAVVLLR